MKYEIKQAAFPEMRDDVISIFREYIASATVDLSFQGNEEEFLQLEEKYAGNNSKIFLAWNNEKAIGCASYRRVTDVTCEMKRVYIRPSERGNGLGRNLVNVVLREAKMNGYQEIFLDVLPEFSVATKLYESLGFANSKPISNNPIPGTKFLSMKL